MNVVYSRRAIADLEHIASYYTAVADPAIAQAVENRIQLVIERISRVPESAQVVLQRPNVRVVPLIRYPYKIFYRLSAERIEILHIRHTSRRPWTE